jgi:hypothetical protein
MPVSKKSATCELSHVLFCKILKKKKKTVKGQSEQKVLNADIWCSAPPYSCLHSSTAGAFQLGVVWPPSLQPWFRSEQLPPTYLPEELVQITVLQQNWGVDVRCQNVAKLTGGRLFWQRHKKLISRYDKCLNSGDEYTEKQPKYVHIFCIRIIILFLIACFVNSSLEVTFQTALILEAELQLHILLIFGRVSIQMSTFINFIHSHNIVDVL